MQERGESRAKITRVSQTVQCIGSRLVTCLENLGGEGRGNEFGEVFEGGGGDALEEYYRVVSGQQEMHCLELFKTRGLAGMKAYWDRIAVEENCEMCGTLYPDRFELVMNRCPKIEYGRLSSEISWMGVNSRTLSSKRAPVPTQGMRLSLNRMSVGGGATAASDRAARSNT